MFAINKYSKNQKRGGFEKYIPKYRICIPCCIPWNAPSLASFQSLPSLTSYFAVRVILESVRSISFDASCFFAFCSAADLFHKYSKFKGLKKKKDSFPVLLSDKLRVLTRNKILIRLMKSCQHTLSLTKLQNILG